MLPQNTREHKFIGLSDRDDALVRGCAVLIACRVSPSQKAMQHCFQHVWGGEFQDQECWGCDKTFNNCHCVNHCGMAGGARAVHPRWGKAHAGNAGHRRRRQRRAFAGWGSLRLQGLGWFCCSSRELRKLAAQVSSNRGCLSYPQAYTSKPMMRRIVACLAGGADDPDGAGWHWHCRQRRHVGHVGARRLLRREVS